MSQYTTELNFVFDKGIKKVYVTYPYYVEKEYSGLCTKDYDSVYELVGGRSRIYFSKYYKISKIKQLGKELVCDGFNVLYIGCFQDIFYITKFDYNKEKYVILYKQYLHKLPDHMFINNILDVKPHNDKANDMPRPF